MNSADVDWRRRTAILAAVFLALVLAFVALRRWGLPVDRTQAVVVAASALVVTSAVGGRRPWRVVVRDWAPLASVVAAYELTRGLADELGRPVRTDLGRLDVAIFGDLPTAWLQRRLYRSEPGIAWPPGSAGAGGLLGPVRWWEVLVAIVYVSHFVVPYGLAALLWWRDRSRWAYWTRRYLAVTAAGLVAFVLVPAAPPWLVGGAAPGEPVLRTTTRGWGRLGLDVADRWVQAGQATVNPVAAMPSLHAAHALLVAVAVWRCAHARGAWSAVSVRAAAAAYAIGMGFVLVLTGEHYVVDVLAGWAIVGVAVVPDWSATSRRLRGVQPPVSARARDVRTRSARR